MKTLPQLLVGLSILMAGGLAEADRFEWSRSSRTTTERLGEIDGQPLRFRAGSTPEGEHLRVAVELCWGARCQLIADEMADAHPAVRRRGRLVVVALGYLPWGEDEPTRAERSYAYDRSRSLWLAAGG